MQKNHSFYTSAIIMIKIDLLGLKNEVAATIDIIIENRADEILDKT